MISRAERLDRFIQTLAESPVASSEQDALRLLAAALNHSEDVYSGIPSDPSTRGTDGRMYPPQEDSRRSDTATPDVARYRTRAHNVFIGKNGAITIRNAIQLEGPPLLRKPGSDGRFVEDM